MQPLCTPVYSFVEILPLHPEGQACRESLQVLHLRGWGGSIVFKPDLCFICFWRWIRIGTTPGARQNNCPVSVLTCIDLLWFLGNHFLATTSQNTLHSQTGFWSPGNGLGPASAQTFTPILASGSVWLWVVPSRQPKQGSYRKHFKINALK